MRFIGAGIIWMSFVYAGYSASRRFAFRKDLYTGFVMLVENVTNEIKYFVKPISEAVLSNSVCIEKKMLNILIAYLNKGYDFPVAWEKSVKEADLPVSSYEKEKIINMVSSLGKSDADIQVNILNSFRNYFIKMAEKAEYSNIKYSSSIFASSVLFGGAVFLILI